MNPDVLVIWGYAAIVGEVCCLIFALVVCGPSVIKAWRGLFTEDVRDDFDRQAVLHRRLWAECDEQEIQ